MAKEKKAPKVSKERIEKIYRFLINSKIQSSDILRIKENEEKYLQIINEALTHSSINSLLNHERLEFHGDAVLRLAASEYIQKNFPQLKVGERSALRAQLVSDEWLAKVGGAICIEKAMEIAPKALNDKAAAQTIAAEGTEALIGALYECLKTVDSIQMWLEPFWHIESTRVLSDPHKQNSKSALQEWSQKKGVKMPVYEIAEVSKVHGDSRRFHCKVFLEKKIAGEGWGSSRKKAEKYAAKKALNSLKS